METYWNVVCYASTILTSFRIPQVDDEFLGSGRVMYTSSIYATRGDPDSVRALYDLDAAGRFPSSGGEDSPFVGVRYEASFNSLYSTDGVGFYEHRMNTVLPWDMVISNAALMVTTLCILSHTKSPFVTLVGLAQILLALPVAWFIYYFILRFPL